MFSGGIKLTFHDERSHLSFDSYCMTSENPLLVVLEGGWVREWLMYIPTSRNNNAYTMVHLQ